MVAGGRELIDTLWNVNHFIRKVYQVLRLELIDTLWNVNSRLRHFKLMLNFELIDTLWNVNESAPADWVEQLRINRYIMECK